MNKIHYNYDKNKININLLYLFKIFKKYDIPNNICKYIYYYFDELAEYNYICVHNNGGQPYTIYYCINKLNKPIYIFDNEHHFKKISKKKWEIVIKKIDGYCEIINTLLFILLSVNNNTYFMKTIEKLKNILITILEYTKIRGDMRSQQIYDMISEFLNIIHNKNKFYYEYISFCNIYKEKLKKTQLNFIKQKVSSIINIFDNLLNTIIIPLLVKKLDNIELFIGNDLQNIPSRIYSKNNKPTIAEEYEDGNIKHYFCHGNSIIFLNKKKKNIHILF